MAVTTEW